MGKSRTSGFDVEDAAILSLVVSLSLILLAVGGGPCGGHCGRFWRHSRPQLLLRFIEGSPKLGMLGRWKGTALGACLVGFVFFVVFGAAVHAEPSGISDEPVGWEVLPSGLIAVQYDRTGDGTPDYFTLHQIMWSGWTAMPLTDIMVQARTEGLWAFSVDYDHDRYVYLTRATPLFFADDPQQDGRWTAVPVESHDETPTVAVLPCSVCMR